MLVSNNNEAALAAANRPPDAKEQGQQCHRLQMTQVNVEMNTKRHGRVVGPKHPLVHELAAMIRPKRPTVSSNEDDVTPAYEYDDLPILESNRTSCCTPRYPVMITASTGNEPEARLSDSVPEGELHVWVYEARQLSAPWSMTNAMDKGQDLRVKCALLGAVQESTCNISGNKTNPVWRQAENGARDGLGGYFAWALGQPDDTAGDRTNRGVEASECQLEIDVVCGERIVGSASVALEDMLLSSKDRAFEKDVLDDDKGSKVVRRSPHWVPLAGNNAGLLQISLEFVPVPTQVLRGSSRSTRLVKSKLEVPDENDAGHQSNDGVAGQRKVCLPRKFVDGRLAFPWLDQKYDDSPLETEDEASSIGKVIVSRSGGVTMYIPTSTPSEASSTGSMPVASKPSNFSFGVSPSSEHEQLMDKQLWDLYYFGISDEVSEKRDLEDFTRTMSMASDYSAGISDLISRPDTSSYCRQASTCASDVLAYNELIQDMESAMKSIEDSAPPRITGLNQEHVKHKAQSQTETITAKSPTPKLHLKMRRINKPNLNFSKPLDRIHSLWHDAKARASNSSDATEGNSLFKERTSGRIIDSCPSSRRSSPVVFRSRSRTPSPLSGEGVVLFDPQNMPMRFPYQRSTSRDEATTKAKREQQAAAAGTRRRSLPINIFPLQHRQDLLLQKQWRKRSSKQQFEAPRGLQPFLLESVDPPLLSRARSNSLHSMTDLFLPKTGDMHGIQVTTSASTSYPASSRVIRGAAKRTTARRHSGSNVVYINGSSLCVGKLINVGNEPGVVRFIGTTRFATGTWVGIELCEQKGKNSGTINGEKYFSCAPNHGIFIRASRLGLSPQ